MARVKYKPRPRNPVRERPARKPPRPANDNIPVANDNLEDLLEEAARSAPDMPFDKWKKVFAPIRAIMSAKSLYDLWQSAQTPFLVPNGWRVAYWYRSAAKAYIWTTSGTTPSTPPAGGAGINGTFTIPAPSGFSETPPGADARRIQASDYFPHPDPTAVHPYAWVNTWGIYAPAGTPLPINRPNFQFQPGLVVDPNVVRNTPGVPVQPDPYDQADPEMVAPEEWQFASPSPYGDPSPHVRQPPGGTVKEGKAQSTSAKVGVALYRALDSISEWSEVADALYEALPASVRSRWDRPDRPIDQFGQYGINGADWKLQALWHNWDKVDIGQAVENIVDNYIEDKVIGAYQKHLPRNVVNALDQIQANGDKLPPEAVVAKMVKVVKEYLGLTYNPEKWMKGI